MNILLISISAPPKNSPESLQTGRYLKYLSRAHTVDLLTTRITGGWEPEDKSLLKYLKDVRQVISLFSFPSRVISLAKKIYPELLMPDEGAPFFWQFAFARKKVRQRPDIIFSRSAPYSSAVMALKMARFWNVPWVLHLSDLWVDSPFLTLNDNLRQKHQDLELKCFEQAQVVTLTSNKTIAFYKKKYPHLDAKFQFLPNVFDADDRNKLPVRKGAKARFVFTGRLYGTRSIHGLMQALEDAVLLRPDLEDRFEVMLAGFFDDENIQRINRSQLKNVTYVGALELNKALELQQSAHVLILIDSLDDDYRYDLFFPSKLLDYLAADRLIIAITNKESTTYDVVEGKAGRCFHQENLDQLPPFIVTLVDQNAAGSPKTTIGGDISQYEASFNVKRLEEIFASAIANYE